MISIDTRQLMDPVLLAKLQAVVEQAQADVDRLFPHGLQPVIDMINATPVPVTAGLDAIVGALGAPKG